MLKKKENTEFKPFKLVVDVNSIEELTYLWLLSNIVPKQFIGLVQDNNTQVEELLEPEVIEKLKETDITVMYEVITEELLHYYKNVVESNEEKVSIGTLLEQLAHIHMLQDMISKLDPDAKTEEKKEEKKTGTDFLDQLLEALTGSIKTEKKSVDDNKNVVFDILDEIFGHKTEREPKAETETKKEEVKKETTEPEKFPCDLIGWDGSCDGCSHKSKC
jgi:hypothetical protein